MNRNRRPRSARNPMADPIGVGRHLLTLTTVPRVGSHVSARVDGSRVKVRVENVDDRMTVGGVVTSGRDVVPGEWVTVPKGSYTMPSARR